VASAVLRALSVCVPVALHVIEAPLIHAAEPAALATDIPAQPLTRALEAFGRQTGLQLIYVSAIAETVQSPGARAGQSTSAALTQLLEGSGLHFEFLNARTIRIFSPPPAVPNGSGVAVAAPQPVAERHATRPLTVEEIVVTANRRVEPLQEVPITIQVLTGKTLAELNARTFDDFVTNLPGVTAHGIGPGQNNIYVRGLATTDPGIQGAGVLGSFPNVAVYLDEQSVQLPHRNLDLYTPDLERIEILEGPQGTLFGAGAQAGVVRYITNKPKLGTTEASVDAGYEFTASGASSQDVNAVVNIPIITDRLAVRGVIYREKRGGYIDNIPAIFARTQAPPDSVVIDNSKLVAADANPVTYSGVRVAGLYQFSEDWSALLTQSYQNIEADGAFAEMATDSLGVPQPDLTTQMFNASFNKDRFENTALTIEGRVGALKLLYAGSYLVRNVEQVQDYTSYARSPYADYYQCAFSYTAGGYFQCFTPSSTWHDVERNTHQSHELRLSTPSNWRVRGIAGLFYEDYQIQEQVDYLYLTAPSYFHPIAPPTGYYTFNGSRLVYNQLVPWYYSGAVFVPSPVTSINPNVRPADDAFFDDITRGYRQKAAYASVDFDLVPEVLTLTVGTRYFNTDNSEVGATVESSYGCSLVPPNYQPVPNPCVNHSYFINVNAEGFDRTFSGFRSRMNLSWKVSGDALLYYTWSQGYRPGGFNRGYSALNGQSPLHAGPGWWQAQARAHGGWAAPLDYAPDDLTNNEFGWKTTWLGRRLQWDGAIYQEDWDHVQIGVYAPQVISPGITTNGGSYRVRGVETSMVAQVAAGLTLEARAAWNHSDLVQPTTFLWADGTPIDFTTLQNSQGQPVANPSGEVGSSLAAAPPFQGAIRVRYEFPLDRYQAFAQLGAVHQAHSLSTTDRITLDVQGNSIAYDLPAFTTYDGALGLHGDAWQLQLYGENLTDTRAQLSANHAQWYKSVTVNRPRTFGLRVTYSYRRQ
jgi:outer membrane receptor protein involved in Fe transport